MWFIDLEKATKQVMDKLGEGANYVCVEKIGPCADGGIVFVLSDHRHIKWVRDGEIIIREEGSWRK